MMALLTFVDDLVVNLERIVVPIPEGEEPMLADIRQEGSGTGGSRGTAEPIKV